MADSYQSGGNLSLELPGFAEIFGFIRTRVCFFVIFVRVLSTMGFSTIKLTTVWGISSKHSQIQKFTEQIHFPGWWWCFVSWEDCGNVCQEVSWLSWLEKNHWSKLLEILAHINIGWKITHPTDLNEACGNDHACQQVEEKPHEITWICWNRMSFDFWLMWHHHSITTYAKTDVLFPITLILHGYMLDLPGFGSKSPTAFFFGSRIPTVEAGGGFKFRGPWSVLWNPWAVEQVRGKTEPWLREKPG